MGNKSSYLPFKVLISYLVLLALVVSVGWVLYTENIFYSKIENQSASENSIVLRISKLFSSVYKAESLARKTIQSSSEADFINYINQTDSLKVRIDSLKNGVSNEYQIKLLDSVTVLLKEKTQNIRKLKTIKNKSSDDASVNDAIKELTELELSLQKLQINDFTKNPDKMGSYERGVLQNYVDYLNKNIPDDSTNTLTKKASDSILAASKRLLYKVKTKAEQKQVSLNREENKLLRNEILISEQLRKVLRVIESEMITSSMKNNVEKDKSLKKINQIVTYAAGLGLLLTIFFSLLITNDFSKSQSYKTQLEVANFKTRNLLKSREQLISTVSHDLKTPLSTIVGYAELLGTSDLTKKQLYYTNNIKNSSEYITRLVQDLLDFSQIEAGKIAIEKAPFSLDNTIREIANNIQSVHKEKNIDLQISIDERLHQNILGDVFRVKQVLINILGNAYKFTSEGYIGITATISPDKEWVMVAVSDSGIGIEKESQELVFEEFAQANESIEKKFGGTGLGLAISKKISNLLGGDLQLKSSSEKGSCFEIRLPLIFGQQSAVSNSVLYTPTHQHKTIIIIDDDADLLNLTTEVLKKYYNVVPFSDGEKALEYMVNDSFDLLITDIQMPIIDGFQLVSAIKNLEKSSYTSQPLMAVTGRGDLSDEVYTNAGFATVVKKPLSPNFLLKTIDALFSNVELPIDGAETKSKKSSNKSFSLESFQLFLNNDQEAIKSVIESFMESTNDNLINLETAIYDLEREQMQSVAHKMAPMFKQIEAKEIAAILNAIELNQYQEQELTTVIADLKVRIKKLFIELQKVLN
ncbi:hybrid sensor histidine kinase/response regulator [Flavobacterium algicola]|uniref:hybrid sensor histidine kinase/response regulator n=1 Tax=Flavobacterium algicola TaxID=556529 RepID=UPI001EFE4658|nr:ATP-binding protein [Flavobacterium algicola]MCG9792134.1 hybrid sensor histidine kinase/response regulator [Flavobacterium algicola]